MSAIFISHRSVDNDEAMRLRAWLQAEGHQQLFLDFDPMDGIPAGVDWEQQLYRQLRRCQALLIVLTPDWLESKWCSNELAIAREKGKAVFVVRAKPCLGSPLIPAIQEVELTTDRNAALIKLSRGLREYGLDPAQSFSRDPNRPIYPGLFAFDIEDAAIFFGRSEESWSAIEALRRLRLQATGSAKFLLITGASGSGKSSLMRAGILARLRKETANWIVIRPLRSTSKPIDELAEALLWAYPAEKRPADTSGFRNRLSAPDAPTQLLLIIKELRLILNRPEATLVIALDQGEEFVAHEAPPKAAALLDLCRSALADTGQELVVVSTIRSDRLATFQEHPSIKGSNEHPELRFETFPLSPMPIERVSEIVRGPARYEGLEVDDALVDALRRDTATPDALPLLAYTLRHLKENLTLAAYQAIGGLEGSVRSQANAAIDARRLTPADRIALRDVFVPGMVRASESGGFLRTQMRYSFVSETARPYIDRLIDPARLLVSNLDPAGNRTIEIAHEALLRVWPLLNSWILEDRENLQKLVSIERAATDYVQANQRIDLLVHQNNRLMDAEALTQVSRFKKYVSETGKLYIQDCRHLQTSRDRQRRRRLAALAIAGGLVFAAVTGGLYAEVNRQRATMTTLFREAAETFRAGDEAGALAPLHAITTSWFPFKPEGVELVTEYWTDSLLPLARVVQDAGPLSVLRVNGREVVILDDHTIHVPITQGARLVGFKKPLDAFVVADALSVSVHDKASFAEILRVDDAMVGGLGMTRKTPQAIFDIGDLTIVHTRTLGITGDEDEPEEWLANLIILFRTPSDDPAQICRYSDASDSDEACSDDVWLSGGIGAVRVPIPDDAKFGPLANGGIAIRYTEWSECDFWSEDDCADEQFQRADLVTFDGTLVTIRSGVDYDVPEDAANEVTVSESELPQFPAVQPEGSHWHQSAKVGFASTSEVVLEEFTFEDDVHEDNFIETAFKVNIVDDAKGRYVWTEYAAGNSWRGVVSCNFDPVGKIVKGCKENELNAIKSSPAQSPDGRWIAQRNCDDSNEPLQLMSTRTVEFSDILPAIDYVIATAFSDDSRRMAALSSANEILLYDIAEGQAATLTATIALPLSVIRQNGTELCDEGRPLLFLGRDSLVGADVDGRLFSVDPSAGTMRWYMSEDLSVHLGHEISAAPSGRLFALYGASSVQLFDAATGLPLSKPFDLSSFASSSEAEASQIYVTNVELANDGTVRLSCNFSETAICSEFDFVRAPPPSPPFAACHTLEFLSGRDAAGNRLSPETLLSGHQWRDACQ
jgi:energy-coupling factor transporter ATP-binding protein EcfA2